MVTHGHHYQTITGIIQYQQITVNGMQYRRLGTRPLQYHRPNYNPYSKAPNTPHIVWANQAWSSGLAGGDWGSLPYSSGTAAGGIVLDGKIYQTSAKSGYFDCIDLRTGKLLWSAPGI